LFSTHIHWPLWVGRVKKGWKKWKKYKQFFCDFYDVRKLLPIRDVEKSMDMYFRKLLLWSLLPIFSCLRFLGLIQLLPSRTYITFLLNRWMKCTWRRAIPFYNRSNRHQQSIYYKIGLATGYPFGKTIQNLGHSGLVNRVLEQSTSKNRRGAPLIEPFTPVNLGKPLKTKLQQTNRTLAESAWWGEGAGRVPLQDFGSLFGWWLKKQNKITFGRNQKTDDEIKSLEAKARAGDNHEKGQRPSHFFKQLYGPLK
jgi:hypothetical protein